MALTLVTGPKQTSYNLDPIYIEFETDLIDGSGNPTEPNLSCYIQLFDNGNIISEINAPFDRLTKKCFADLSGAMSVQADLPDDAAIDDFATGVANRARTKLSLAYGEMYGDPVVVPTTLASTDEFYVLHGSSPYWYGLGPNPTPNRLLHSYITPDGRFAVKEMRVNQPEFVYYFINTGTVSASWEIEYTDGTTDSGSVPALSNEAGAINWANVGFSATGAAAAADDTKSIHLYKVNFSGISGENTLYYHIDDHDTTHDLYICYDNGIGGVEVLRCSGRHEYGVSGSKDIYRKARVIGSNYRDGLTGIASSSGAMEIVLNTGFYNRNYLLHLGHLVISKKVWFIDRSRTKFVSCRIKEDNIKLINEADDLYSTSFTIVFDEKPGVSTLLQ
jgi:hypothetical protein